MHMSTTTTLPEGASFRYDIPYGSYSWLFLWRKWPHLSFMCIYSTEMTNDRFNWLGLNCEWSCRVEGGLIMRSLSTLPPELESTDKLNRSGFFSHIKLCRRWSPRVCLQGAFSPWAIRFHAIDQVSTLVCSPPSNVRGDKKTDSLTCIGFLWSALAAGGPTPREGL